MSVVGHGKNSRSIVLMLSFVTKTCMNKTCLSAKKDGTVFTMIPREDLLFLVLDGAPPPLMLVEDSSLEFIKILELWVRGRRVVGVMRHLK